MAKSKINYSALKKTADGKGVMFCTVNGENYLFNSFCIIKGLDDVQFEIAIEKSSAKKAIDILGKNFDAIISCFNDWFDNDKAKETIDTCISKAEKDGKTVEFFKIQNKNRDIVLIDNNFLQIFKKEKLVSVRGVDDKSPLCFELLNNAKVLVLPIIGTDEYINNTNRYTNKIKNFLKEIDFLY